MDKFRLAKRPLLVRKATISDSVSANFLNAAVRENWARMAGNDCGSLTSDPESVLMPREDRIYPDYCRP